MAEDNLSQLVGALGAWLEADPHEADETDRRAVSALILGGSLLGVRSSDVRADEVDTLSANEQRLVAQVRAWAFPDADFAAAPVSAVAGGAFAAAIAAGDVEPSQLSLALDESLDQADLEIEPEPEVESGEVDGSGVVCDESGEADGSGVVCDESGEVDGSGVVCDESGEVDGSGVVCDESGEVDAPAEMTGTPTQTSDATEQAVPGTTAIGASAPVDAAAEIDDRGTGRSQASMLRLVMNNENVWWVIAAIALAVLVIRRLF